LVGVVVAGTDWFGSAWAPAAAVDKVAASARVRLIGCVMGVLLYLLQQERMTGGGRSGHPGVYAAG
jgi:hypothetical protein